MCLNVWQDPADLERLLACMAANALPALDWKIEQEDPYQFLLSAANNKRNVGFIPKGIVVSPPFYITCTSLRPKLSVRSPYMHIAS